MRLAVALAAALLALPNLLAMPAAAQSVAERPVLTLAGARIVVAAAEAQAIKMGLKVTIVVVDPWGVPIAMQRMDEASLVGPEIALAKARTSANFNQPTKTMQERLFQDQGMRLLTLPATLVDGAVPVKQGGKTVGAIGVSGATSAQDGEIAVAGAAAVAK